jgi:uncharacterized membrane protein
MKQFKLMLGILLVLLFISAIASNPKFNMKMTGSMASVGEVSPEGKLLIGTLALIFLGLVLSIKYYVDRKK